MQRFFKAKCAKNWYRDISGFVLHTLKGFCMAKSAKNLGVNIALSECEFFGVGPLKEHSRAHRNQHFCMYLILPPFAEVICKNAILSKYAAG